MLRYDQTKFSKKVLRVATGDSEKPFYWHM